MRTLAPIAVFAVLGALAPATTHAVDLPVAAIGKVTHAGFSSRGQCTGILIAPDLVLTAAHCLTANGAGAPVPVGDLHFLAGYDKGNYLAHARARAVTFAPGHEEATTDAARLATDAAIIELTEPLTLAIPLRATTPPDNEQAVVYAGYFQSRREALTISDPCGVLVLSTGLWASNCHAEPGGSGGPVFALTKDGPRLAGIMAAVNETGVSYVVPLSLITPLLPASP